MSVPHVPAARRARVVALGLGVAALLAVGAPGHALDPTHVEPLAQVDGNYVEQMSATLTSENTVVAVWNHKQTQSATTSEVRAAVRRPGQEWQSKVVLGRSTPFTQAQVAAAKDGKAIAVWVDATHKLRSSTWRPGHGWSAVTTVSGSHQHALGSPALAVDPTSKRWAVAYATGKPRTGTDTLRVAVHRSGSWTGQTVGTRECLTETDHPLTTAIDDRGDVAVGWTKYGCGPGTGGRISTVLANGDLAPVQSFPEGQSPPLLVRTPVGLSAFVPTGEGSTATTAVLDSDGTGGWAADSSLDEFVVRVITNRAGDQVVSPDLVRGLSSRRYGQDWVSTRAPHTQHATYALNEAGQIVAVGKRTVRKGELVESDGTAGGTTFSQPVSIDSGHPQLQGDQEVFLTDTGRVTGVLSLAPAPHSTEVRLFGTRFRVPTGP